MRVAGLLGPGLPRKHRNQGRIALDHFLQAGQDITDFFETMDALRAAAKLAGGLRAAQEKNTDQGSFRAAEVEGFPKPVFVFRDAAIG